MAMSIESVAHLNPTSPVMGNATAGAGERKVVKRNPSTDVYFTTRMEPRQQYREAEYQETIGRFSDLYCRRFCTFHHVLHRACSSHVSRFYVALMLIRVAYSLGILIVFLGIMDYFRPPVPMYHLYSILNHLRVPRLWVEGDHLLELEITRRNVDVHPSIMGRWSSSFLG